MKKTEKQISLKTFVKERKILSLRTSDIKVLILSSKQSSFVEELLHTPDPVQKFLNYMKYVT